MPARKREQGRQFRQAVAEKSARKRRARSNPSWSLWMGFGMFGVVGWSVALPTVAGAALGLWIDRRWPGPYSWTLMMLFVGVAAGCFNGWSWISREREGIERERRLAQEKSDREEKRDG